MCQSVAFINYLPPDRKRRGRRQEPSEDATEEDTGGKEPADVEPANGDEDVDDGDDSDNPYATGPKPFDPGSGPGPMSDSSSDGGKDEAEGKTRMLSNWDGADFVSDKVGLKCLPVKEDASSCPEQCEAEPAGCDTIRCEEGYECKGIKVSVGFGCRGCVKSECVLSRGAEDDACCTIENSPKCTACRLGQTEEDFCSENAVSGCIKSAVLVQAIWKRNCLDFCTNKDDLWPVVLLQSTSADACDMCEYGGTSDDEVKCESICTQSKQSQADRQPADESLESIIEQSKRSLKAGKSINDVIGLAEDALGVSATTSTETAARIANFVLAAKTDVMEAINLMEMCGADVSEMMELMEDFSDDERVRRQGPMPAAGASEDSNNGDGDGMDTNSEDDKWDDDAEGYEDFRPPQKAGHPPPPPQKLSSEGLSDADLEADGYYDDDYFLFTQTSWKYPIPIKPGLADARGQSEFVGRPDGSKCTLDEVTEFQLSFERGEEALVHAAGFSAMLAASSSFQEEPEDGGSGNFDASSAAFSMGSIATLFAGALVHFA
jgi:hypothetical protein